MTREDRFLAVKVYQWPEGPEAIEPTIVYHRPRADDVVAWLDKNPTERDAVRKALGLTAAVLSELTNTLDAVGAPETGPHMAEEFPAYELVQHRIRWLAAQRDEALKPESNAARLHRDELGRVLRELDEEKPG